MAGRIRTAITSLEPARAACHPSGPERSGGGAQRFDSPLAEVIPPVAEARSVRRAPGAAGVRFDTGLPGRRPRHGLGRLPVGLLFQLLAGLEVGDALRRRVHTVAGPRVAAPVQLGASETRAAEAAQFDILPSAKRLGDAAEHVRGGRRLLRRARRQGPAVRSENESRDRVPRRTTAWSDARPGGGASRWWTATVARGPSTRSSGP